MPWHWGVAMPLEVVRAGDVWVTRGAWRQEAGGECLGVKTCTGDKTGTCQTEGSSRDLLKG